MPWFKVDDAFESHPKVKAIPRSKRPRAVGLWTLAGCWAARSLTDGFVPRYMIDELACTVADARALVAVGLWSECDGGYQFKDWHDWQPTREKVESDRSAARERMKAARERKKQASSANVRANISEQDANFGERSGEVRSTPRSLTPARPDPTRPDQQQERDDDADAPPSRALAVVGDVTPTAQTLIGEWIDHCAEPPPSRVKGHVAREVKQMLDDGIPYERVRAGLADWNSRGLHPSTLPSIVHELANKRASGSTKQQETDDLFARAAARMGVQP